MKRSTQFCILALVAVATMLGAVPALGDYGPRLDVEELTTASVAVVRGHVYAVDAAWGDVRNIYTYVRVDVAEVLAGAGVPERIIVKQLGGVVADLGQYVGGAPAYLPGEEVVLFLVTRPRDTTVYTAGFWQGKWNVTRDRRGVRARRHAGLDDAGAEVQPETLDLDSIRQMVAATVVPTARAPRDIRWIPVDAPPARNTVHAPSAQKFSLLGFSWHEVFAGASIPFDFHRAGQPGVGKGRKQMKRVVKDWNKVKRTANALARGKRRGGAAPGTGLRNGDASVLLQNGDPLGEVSNTDGTLAIGGAWAGGPAIRKLVPGVSGYVVMNDAQQAMLSSRNCYENVLKHEGGHAVGQGHSNKTGNLMFPSIDFGTCTGGIVKLGKDDQRGHRKMYHRRFVTRERR